MEIISSFETVTRLTGSTATEYFAQTAMTITGAAHREQYEKSFTPKALLHLSDEQLSFEAQNEAWLNAYVRQEDLERVIANCKIKHIWAQIKDGNTYKFSFGMRMPDGAIRRKQLQFIK
ncbi:hypothetical protein [Butyricicoccus sp. Marseille-Q5471]|uniref:hypothetical protein n=1 Tax=Butyricicoccus sp. Marseille-Q5471 TaxID=3039493 RepID=UPI0024BBFE5E|nr:hypothetical protein [Butyricicoccus sp. Marseille-Q5471]